LVQPELWQSLEAQCCSVVGRAEIIGCIFFCLSLLCGIEAAGRVQPGANMYRLARPTRLGHFGMEGK
jgi:hypothetical protein